MLIPNWFGRYADPAATATEQTFEFGFEGATIRGKIDRIGPGPDGATRITDYKTGRSDDAPKPADSLQLGIYYLAVDGTTTWPSTGRSARSSSRTWAARRRTRSLDVREWPITKDEEEDYKTRMRERIGALVERIHGLDRDRRYVASTTASCFFCRFQPLCTRYPQGGAVFPIADAARAEATSDDETRRRTRGRRRPAATPPRDMTATYPEPIVEFLGGEPTPEQMAGDLVAARAVRGRRRGGLGKTSVMAARVIYLAMVATGALAGRAPRRDARRRALPDVHEQGDREPDDPDPPGPSDARTSPRARSPRSSTTTRSRRRCSNDTGC